MTHEGHRRRRWVLIGIEVLIVTCAGTACGSSSVRSQPKDAVAVVGEQAIPRAAVAAFLAATRATDKQHEITFPEPGTPAYLAARNQAIDYFVQASEIEQRARDALGIEVSAKQVAASIRRFRIQTFSGSSTKMRATMRKFGWGEALLESSQRLRLTEQAIKNKLTAGVEISPSDVRAYYDQHRSSYRKPERRTIRDILLKQKLYAQTLYRQVKNGASFSKIARQYLDDSISPDQSDEFTISRGETVSSFEDVVFRLRTGQLSRPVHTKYGWYLIQAVSPVRPPEVTSFSRVRQSISRQLLLNEQRSILEKWRTAAIRYFCAAGRITYQPADQPVSATCAATTPSTPQLG